MKIATFGIVSNVKKKEIREVMSRVISLVPDGVRIVALEETASLLDGDRIDIRIYYFGSCGSNLVNVILGRQS